eukprot:6979245-Pyramimonas_sp.AAC.1
MPCLRASPEWKSMPRSGAPWAFCCGPAHFPSSISRRSRAPLDEAKAADFFSAARHCRSRLAAASNWKRRRSSAAASCLLHE